MCKLSNKLLKLKNRFSYYLIRLVLVKNFVYNFRQGLAVFQKPILFLKKLKLLGAPTQVVFIIYH